MKNAVAGTTNLSFARTIARNSGSRVTRLQSTGSLLSAELGLLGNPPAFRADYRSLHLFWLTTPSSGAYRRALVSLNQRNLTGTCGGVHQEQELPHEKT